MSEDRSPAWEADEELQGFQSLKLYFAADYDGPVVSTLVRRRAGSPSRKAFLFVHGWNDYFFQEHLAEACNAHGFNFYAIDMRKYGRSLGGAPHPNFCKDMREYLSDISAAIAVVTGEEDNDYLVLGGHSTGGLICSLYANQGALRTRVDALWLNSPFFAFNSGGGENAALLPVIVLAGRFAPFATIGGLSTAYGESLHRDYHGEWLFNKDLKPIKPFPTYFGWVRAVFLAQQRVRRGLDIECPVLLMHSDKSIYGKEWRPDFQAGDAVLNVDDMRAAVGNLGANVEEVEIRDGLHDLTLSRADVRERVFEELFAWLARVASAAPGATAAGEQDSAAGG